MAITIVQERVVLYSPVATLRADFIACGDRVIISDNGHPRNDDFSLEQAHIIFDEMWERGWR
jgi:hypothetical protein